MDQLDLLDGPALDGPAGRTSVNTMDSGEGHTSAALSSCDCDWYVDFFPT